MEYFIPIFASSVWGCKGRGLGASNFMVDLWASHKVCCEPSKCSCQRHRTLRDAVFCHGSRIPDVEQSNFGNAILITWLCGRVHCGCILFFLILKHVFSEPFGYCGGWYSVFCRGSRFECRGRGPTGMCLGGLSPLMTVTSPFRAQNGTNCSLLSKQDTTVC